jgi:hypothetical protein
MKVGAGVLPSYYKMQRAQTKQGVYVHIKNTK